MKPILYLLTICLGPIFGFAQSIQGKITDSRQNPLEDVFIYSTRSGSHTHTDVRGVFSFDGVSAGDTLILESFGFATRYIRIDTSQSAFNWVLSPLSVTLDQVSVSPGSNINDMITRVDLNLNPVSSSQALLPVMPGLFIGQHAGGGKAEQIFLRGFDIDHGTDLRITVDGMPVNMSSHAHGQGYADLHFLIPETVDKVDFSKGPYDVSQGNFATAGQIGFETKDHVDQSQFIQEAGQYNTWRSVLLLDLVNNSKQAAYVAGEFRYSDGPFVSPQNFSRWNGLGKWTYLGLEHHRFSLTASGFTSTWLASGQVPQRAVDSGLISRFGAIDDTEGGSTSRYNALLQHQFSTSRNDFIKTDLWYSRYQFDLFSNFTFFLEDPVNGDQIRQKENRDLFGLNSKWIKEWRQNEFTFLSQAGVFSRNDLSFGNGLTHTLNRTQVLNTLQMGDIRESGAGIFAKQKVEWKDWSAEAGVRYDYYRAIYENHLAPGTSNSIADRLISPSLSISYTPDSDLQLYGKIGRGFHSNDARIAIYNQRSYLTPAWGTDLGLVYKVSSKLLLDAAVWNLLLDEEMVYVGDAGVVEPSGKSRRYGLDAGLRYAPASWVHLRLDANYTIARSIEDAEGENYIPLAPRFTSAASLSMKHPSGIKANLSYRFMGERPANEDFSIVAKPYFITDFNAVYSWRKFDFGFVIDNLFNAAWNETQFATESRLFDETNPVEEIHFIPGTPFATRLKLGFRF